MTVTISRWGNSLGVRLPKAALEEAHLTEGDQVSVLSQDGQLVLVKTRKRNRDELIAKITTENRHAEAFPALAGNEVW